MKADFPYLDEYTRFQFPPADKATEHGIVGVGGNLSPGMLLSAYSQGIFPWYSENEPLLWWNPDPRFILYPDQLHVSRRLGRLLKTGPFDYSFDTSFRDVIEACSRIPRPGQEGTWITPDMIDAYTELHTLGYAHSMEVYAGGELVGGLYGISLGRCFFGESMFSTRSGASKAALVRLVGVLKPRGFVLIDCQVRTDHLAAMGAKDVPRSEFLSLLSEGLAAETHRGSWASFLSD